MDFHNWQAVKSGDSQKFIPEKLLNFGFHEEETENQEKLYLYREMLFDGAFCVHVAVDNGNIFTLVMDEEAKEPYILHLVQSAEGKFVGRIRAAYETILERVRKECGAREVFSGEYIENILHYVKARYGDSMEYPWDKIDAAVIRSHITQKWYAVFMRVSPDKIGATGEGKISIMSLHGTEAQILRLVDGKKYFIGYHMNRKYWYTVHLDGSVSLAELFLRIDESFALSQRKKGKKREKNAGQA